MLKKAYVEITNRCNLACSFCPKTKREPRTMSAQEFGLVLSRLEGYVQYVYLHVMGEPLLHPELTTLFALAKAWDMKICITTNGTLLQISTRHEWSCSSSSPLMLIMVKAKPPKKRETLIRMPPTTWRLRLVSVR